MYSKPFLAGVEYYEGFYPRRYLDPVGKWTIGIGHLVVPGDPYDANTVLSHDQAIDLLMRDLVPGDESWRKNSGMANCKAWVVVS